MKTKLLNKLRFSGFPGTRNLKENSEGSLTIFGLMTFVTMIGLAGFAIDVARFEAERSKIQIVLDNAVLAAASLDQSINPATGQLFTPQEVIDLYLAKADLPAGFDATPITGDYVVETISNSSSEREVRLTANMALNTIFMDTFGQDTLTASPTAGAIEADASDTEIVLVLDVSGSMKGTVKLGSLVDAAKEFVTSMLQKNDLVPNSVSVSLVPYSTYVNLGDDLYESMVSTSLVADPSDFVQPHVGNTSPVADLATTEGICAELTNEAFDTIGIPDLSPSNKEMSPHMTYGYYDWGPSGYASSGTGMGSPYCGAYSWAQITPHSKSEQALHAQLDAFEAIANTSIDDGVKWGAALLDPSMQPTMEALSLDEDSSQHVDPVFAGRPAAYGTSNKILVVMTDGFNTTQYKLKDNKISESPSGYFFRDSDNYVSKYSQSGSEWQQLTYRELWSVKTVWQVANDRGKSWSYYEESFRSGSTKNQNLQDACNAAKAQNITIFTITYQASSSSAAVMEDCATNSSTAQEASSADISSVFANIGLAVRKLRLTE